MTPIAMAAEPERQNCDHIPSPEYPARDDHLFAENSMVQRKVPVLVVDDEFLIADLLSTMLRDMGLDVCGTAATAANAIALAEAKAPGLVLMDVRLQGQLDGIEAARTIRQATGAVVIFITGSDEPTTIARIERDDPAAVLHKPIRFDELQRAVLQAIA
jgi:CheY-like chemotaxis protein